MRADPGFEGIEGIVLDAVGTLIEPRPSVSSAYVAAAERQGVALDVAVVRGRFREAFAVAEGGDLRGPLATDEAAERRRWRAIVARCLPEVPDPDRAFAELWDHFADPASWRVFPDAAPALRRLREAGYRVCVASNFDGRLRRVAAGLPEWRDWGGPVVISSEVGHRKPHPAFYRAACASLGLEPGRVLSAGDDLVNDVTGPREAGLRAVLVDRSGRGGGELPAVPDLGGLADLLVGKGGGESRGESRESRS